MCAWYVAEGWPETQRRAIRICQSERANPRYVDELDGLFGPWSKRYVRADGIVVWRVGGDLGERIRHWLPEKSLRCLRAGLSARQARLFLYEFARADGYWPRLDYVPPPKDLQNIDDMFPAGSAGGPLIYQSDPQIMDDLQLLATIGGLRSSVICRRVKELTLQIMRKSRGASFAHVVKRERVIAEGVWCPETPTGTWVARRDGRAFVTGNSHPVDCLGYGLGRLYPAHKWLQRALETRVPRTEPAQAARSWLGH